VLVGALGNGSGAPLDGAQSASFGANDGGELTIVGDEDGGDDPLDPAMTTVLTTCSDRSGTSLPDPRLPVVRFAPTVTAYPGVNTTIPSTTMGNASGAGVTTNATASAVPTSSTAMANTSGVGAANTSQSGNSPSQNDP